MAGRVVTIGADERGGGETPHAVYGASGASIYMNCAGMFNLLENARAAGAVPVQDQGSIYAREGTAAHDAGEQVILHALTNGKRGKPTVEAPDWVEDKDGFVAAVQVYVDECLTNDLSVADAWAGVEVQVDLNELYERNDFLLDRPAGQMAKDAALFGTADFVGLSAAGTLIVIDYKHGAGVPVEAEGNPQIKYYALGAMIRAKAMGLNVNKVQTCIVQPRAPGLDVKWAEVMTPADLWAFGTELVAAIVATYNPDAKLSAGTWCRFCKAAQAPCPKLAERAREAAKAAFGPIGDDGKPSASGTDAAALTAEELAFAAAEMPIMQEWMKNLQRALTGRLARGESIPGFKPVRGRKQRTWDDPGAVTAKLQEMGLNQAFTTTLRSPAQVEKLRSAATSGVDFGTLDHVLQSHVIQPRGSVTYAPEDDPRPAVDTKSSGFDPIEE